ncbi:MAG: UTP--glucose-1-phosphate uridylyltransferase GalU [Candidatus Aenigmatarchaeota archaeon]
MEVRKAVIPAAGLGTRFLPATKAMPKEMLPVIDKPVIQFVVEEAISAGIKDILTITGRGKRSIEDHFDHCPELERALEKKGKNKELENLRKISEMANVHYIRQKEPLGLGHAILCAKDHVGEEPFVVMLGDDFYMSKVPHIRQLLDAYYKLKSPILSVKEVLQKDVSRYGIIDGKKIGEKTLLVKSIVEKPDIKDAPSNTAWMGRAILTPEIFGLLKKTKPGFGGEIQLTDAIRDLCKVRDVYAFFYKGKRYDVGTVMEYLKAIIEYGLVREDINGEFKAYLKSLKI